jgi:hypothetical protein
LEIAEVPTYSASSVDPGGSSYSTTGKIVGSIPNVWCDYYCQNGTSCFTYLNTAGSPTIPTPSAGWSTPACTSAKLTETTPPLFEYLPSTGTKGCTASVLPLQAQSSGGCAFNNASTYMDLDHTGTVSINGTTENVDSANLSSIGDVLLNLTIVSNPSSQTSTETGAQPGVSLSQQIDLSNVINQQTLDT